jgi:hypothetical protein
MIKRQSAIYSGATLFATCLLALFYCDPAFGQSKETFNETRQLLAVPVTNGFSSQQLGTLFRIGDVRIADLIQALDDSDENVRLNARSIIRYLGNEKGLEILLKHAKGKNFIVPPPVPLPISEWDYQWVQSQYLTGDPEFDMRSISYIYALALDGSRRATSVLHQLISTAKKRKIKLPALSYIRSSLVGNVFIGERDLMKAVLSNAFFLSPRARRLSTARLISYNGIKNKALIEIHVSGGYLAEEWYHVVISKHGRGWRVFSITLVAVS